jgi:hypothetical protein
MRCIEMDVSVRTLCMRCIEMDVTVRTLCMRCIEMDVSVRTLCMRCIEMDVSVRTLCTRCIEMDVNVRTLCVRCIEMDVSVRTLCVRCIEMDVSVRTLCMRCIEMDVSVRTLCVRCMEMDVSVRTLCMRCMEMDVSVRTLCVRCIEMDVSVRTLCMRCIEMDVSIKIPPAIYRSHHNTRSLHAHFNICTVKPTKIRTLRNKAFVGHAVKIQINAQRPIVANNIRCMVIRVPCINLIRRSLNRGHSCHCATYTIQKKQTASHSAVHTDVIYYFRHLLAVQVQETRDPRTKFCSATLGTCDTGNA